MTDFTRQTAAPEASSAGPYETWQQLWHFGTGNSGIKLQPIAEEYTGAGVKLAVIDDGFDHAHVDLAGKYRKDLDYDARSKDSDAAAEGSDAHGTAVMGVAGGATNNGGTRGVATGADLIGIRIGFESAWSMDAILRAQNHAKAHADIVNMSYGHNGMFTDNYRTSTAAIRDAFADGVQNGRGGLGVVYVASAGNSRTSNQDTNASGMKADPNVIVVAATDAQGNVSSFSTPGASILVAAPGVSILASDRTGAAGYASGDLALVSGTSFSAPIVSGVVALMLEANAGLGYRDVQEILALTATRSASNTVWAVNGSKSWNGGGMHVSHDLGFGLVNAEAAVRLAEMWSLRQTAANDVAVALTTNSSLALRDNGSVSSTLTVAAGDRLDHVESVQVTLNISHSRVSDLVVTLTSPSGTTVTLVNRPANGTSSGGILFDVSATAFRGEQENGAWTLTVTDKASGTSGTLNGWSLKLVGDQPSADTLYVYTDEYGLMWSSDRAKLRDTDGGIDTLMLAAMNGAAEIDLNGGAGSLGGKAFSIEAGSRIEKVILGSGADRVLGSGEADHVLGNRGADTLLGLAGQDSLYGGAGDDSLTGGAGADDLTGGAGRDRFGYGHAQDAGDRLRDFSLAEGDRIDASLLLQSLGWSGSVAAAVQAGRFALSAVTGGALLSIDLTGGGQWLGLVTIDGLSASTRLEQIFDSSAPAAAAVFAFVDADAGVWGTGATWGRGGTRYQLFDAGKLVKAMSLDLASGILSLSGKRASAAPAITVDEVLGGAGNDTVSGSALADLFRGGAGQDLLTGRDGDDVLLGEAGNDKLDGGSGVDRLDGGAGNDTLLGGDGADRLLGGAGRDSLSGGTGDDRLEGGTEDDKLQGDDGQDLLTGEAGNDQLLGGAGNDTLSGDEGNDQLSGDAGHDSLTGGAGNDQLAGGAGNDTLSGGLENDRLTGDADNDILSGGDGNDSLDGGTGNDLLQGDAGNDTLLGGDGNDSLEGGAGADLLTGGKGADLFVAHASGGDTITDWSTLDGDRLDLTGLLAALGYSGSDAFADGILAFRQTSAGAVLWSQSGAPVAIVTLAKAFAADTQILGGTSINHTYLLRDGMLAGQRVALEDATGIDRIDLSRLSSGAVLDLNAGKGGTLAGGTLTLGRGVIEQVTGTGLADVLTGNSAANLIEGGAGADLLSGAAGDDTLIGGAGADRMNGGAGADVFGLGLDAIDRVEDFKTLEGDRLDLTEVLAALNMTLTQALSAQRLRLVQEGLGANLQVNLGAGFTSIAWLGGVSAASAVTALVSGVKSAPLPLLVQTQGSLQTMAETGDAQSWNLLREADWTTMGGSLAPVSGGTSYDLSQIAGAVSLSMASGTGTLKGATLTFQGAVHDLKTGDLADKITTGAGADQVWSGGGNDTVTGGLGDNLLVAGAGDDQVKAGGGQDWLFGGEGHDKLYGEDGQDSLSGDAGNDQLDGGAGHDLLTGGEGRDKLYGQAGQDSLSGGNEADTLDGGADNDLLMGDAGDDLLSGGTGNDRLEGGAGADRLTGGTGADRFVFTTPGSLDTITDFKASDGDRLEISGLLSSLGRDSVALAWADGAIRGLASGRSTLVQVEEADGVWVNLVMLDRIIASSVTQDWFV